MPKIVKDQRNVVPSSIRFTQDSISEQFERDSGETLEETFRQLLYGETSVEAVSMIKVVWCKGTYWVTSGNKRLYLYRRLQEKGRLSTVPVAVRPLDERKVDYAIISISDLISKYLLFGWCPKGHPAVENQLKPQFI